MTKEEIIEKILKWPADERKEIAKALLASLDDRESVLTDKQIETIKRRVNEIESGEANMIPLSEVKKEMRKRFPKKHHYPL
ncbi:addiction module protein [Fodinibius salsisoli]|uniref:Addiction module protein n=1 Tax=Fodinibius salsisoli TaxID=2820877 RepID=A0ABT3PSJ3_9BACT|nr:addiction module protein [Fodinibius salsisoli]MCW9708832.1 addiction module protein [Fodinibius salsisoli]